MNKRPKERKMLMAQMRNYRCRIAPFDVSFDDNESPSTWWYSLEDSFAKNEDHICQLANKLFSITPHAAGCERIWSTLEWYYGKRRTRLSLSKIENMQKLSAFYVANSKNELPYFAVNKTVEDLHKILCDINFYNEESLEDESITEEQDGFTFPEEDILEIEELLNLDAADFMNDLGDVIMDTDFNFSEEEGTVIQDDDGAEEDWDPEQEADAILDDDY